MIYHVNLVHMCKAYKCILMTFLCILGIKPAPRCWLRWNMEKLEPPNIKMREEIMNASKKKCLYHS